MVSLCSAFATFIVAILGCILSTQVSAAPVTTKATDLANNLHAPVTATDTDCQWMNLLFGGSFSVKHAFIQDIAGETSHCVASVSVAQARGNLTLTTGTQASNATSLHEPDSPTFQFDTKIDDSNDYMLAYIPGRFIAYTPPDLIVVDIDDPMPETSKTTPHSAVPQEISLPRGSLPFSYLLERSGSGNHTSSLNPIKRVFGFFDPILTNDELAQTDFLTKLPVFWAPGLCVVIPNNQVLVVRIEIVKNGTITNQVDILGATSNSNPSGVQRIDILTQAEKQCNRLEKSTKI